PDAQAALGTYGWPGNVRELSNPMERVALLVDAPVVTAAMLDLSSEAGTVEPPLAPASSSRALEVTLGAVERTRLLEALDDTFWNVTRAARQLGISRDTLRYRIAKHRLRPGGLRPYRGAEPAAETAPPSPARAAAVPDAAPSSVRWEPRRVTLLRALIDGPPLEDDRLYPSRLIETFIQKARSFGGRVGALGPSGIVAAFGLEPVEDATRRAAHAAVAIRKAVERGRRAEAPRVTVRLGIHVTQLLVGHAGRDIRLGLGVPGRGRQAVDGLGRP